MSEWVPDLIVSVALAAILCCGLYFFGAFDRTTAIPATPGDGHECVYKCIYCDAPKGRELK